MESILVPIDGSAPSQRALEFVLRTWGGSPELQVHLVNVQVPPPAEMVLEAAIAPVDWEAEAQKTGQEVIDAACKAIDAAGQRYTATVCIGSPAEQIVARARELGCTLIVMGTRGLSSLASLVLGSVATRVIHAAHCPVTLVK